MHCLLIGFNRASKLTNPHRHTNYSVFNLLKLLKCHVSSSSKSSAAVATDHAAKLIRNIGIIAHIDAGKTTTTERMLYYSGLTRHMGDVDDGDTVMDYMEQERNRGITITSAAITFLWRKHKMNLIDTPGHVDFTLEVERALRVLDGAVTILDASAGVEAQTLTVWRQADRYSIPRIIYLNKMDKLGANFAFSVQSLKEKLNANPLIIQIPIGHEKEFEGVVDLIKMSKVTWTDTEGTKFASTPLTQQEGELWETALQMREQLLGQLCDVSETIAEKILSDSDILSIQDELIYSAIRTATIKHNYCPVLCGSSFKKKGVQALLDAIVLYLPSPAEVHHDFLEYYSNNMCALAFKTIHDKQRGVLTFLRIYSGEVANSSSIYNVNRNYTEKISRLLQVHADNLKELQSASAGNIVAVSGLKETITGDTITKSQSAAKDAEKMLRRKMKKANQENEEEEDQEKALLVGMVVPDPVFFRSIEPPSLAAQKPLDHALSCLTKEDPSFKVRIDEETGQTILGGMGELHLEIIHDRILKEYGIETYMGPLMIAYKETISKEASHTEVLDYSIGDTKQHVEITLTVKPTESLTPPKAITFAQDRQQDLNNSLKKFHFKALNGGLMSSLNRGPLFGYGVVGFEVELSSFVTRYGTTLPSMIGCVSQAIYNALKKANPILLEPMMTVEVQTDENNVGKVMSDLAHRRGDIHEVEPRDSARTIMALTPLSELLGYSTALRTMTSGTASLSMELATYRKMSQNEQNRILEESLGINRRT